MKTKLKDLNEMMFSQLERLNSDDFGTADAEFELANVVEQSKAMSGLARNVIEIHRLELEAAKAKGRLIDSAPQGFQQ